MTTRETYPDQVTLADVQAAADCLTGVAVRTPLLAFGPFDDEIGAPRVWLKPENLQPIGAFKIRGAYNALATLSPRGACPWRGHALERQPRPGRGPGGTHAGHAGGHRHARRRTPPSRSTASAPTGPRSTSWAPTTRSASRAPTSWPRSRAWCCISSYDDARIVAGQGTVGLEIVEQLAEMGRANEPLTVLRAHRRRRPLVGRLRGGQGAAP